jgi:ribosomal protein S18 acetylase RimI-like enzyme
MGRSAALFSKDKENYGVFVLYVQPCVWNQLCQIQGLAIDPEVQRKGIASALVDRAEDFAKMKKVRGIYVDTPTLNSRARKFYEAVGYQVGYIMPRYYEDALDGITYQKFFDTMHLS